MDGNTKNGDAGKNKKILICVLVGLGILIIGLVIGLIVTFNSKKSDGTIDTPDEMEAAMEIDKKITEEAVYAREEATKLLEQNPVDVNRINELYNNAISLALNNNRADYMAVLVYDRNELLTAKGLKKEALDALLSLDYSTLSEPNKYRTYTLIVDLARELGENDVLAEYEELQKSVSRAYHAEKNSTQRQNDKDEAIENGTYVTEDQVVKGGE
ncbi:hypothetical protein IKE87_01790 [Candidatus Saccharibacteria bacterium]|nr:hypothetical protein [Candidatus Saccharibacteria bacterium]